MVDELQRRARRLKPEAVVEGRSTVARGAARGEGARSAYG